MSMTRNKSRLWPNVVVWCHRLRYPVSRLLCRASVPWRFRKVALAWYALDSAAWALGADPYYEWKWFGVPLDAIPPAVNIGGRRMSVTVHEGAVMFSQRDCIYGHYQRVTFSRCNMGLWYVEIESPFGRILAADVTRMAAIVAAVYGGDWEFKRDL